MGAFKKYDGSVWQSINPKQLKGIPYTGTLPAVLTGTKAGYLHKYKIYGNLEQTGTPMPENPIYPSECGELETTGVHAGQYKLPLTSAGQGVDIYLGEVQTTRYIVKTVLTSSTRVDWAKSSSRNYAWYFSPQAIGVKANTPFLCSHGATVTSVSDYIYGTVYCDNTVNLGIFPSTLTTVNAVKAWLDEQNANGTPVVIWNVLATPTTGTLNEPLRKIGDYADTIDSTQASVQIPTAAGSTTISWAGSGLAPSEFDSIQEWVDIQTYKRVNGEWVAEVETVIYGFHVDPSISDPANAVTYLLDAVGMTPAAMGASTFDYGSWENTFFMPKPCMLKSDGTVDYYLDPNDYTKKADGTASDIENPNYDGNAMMEWGKIWFKFASGEADGEGYFYVSNVQIDDSYRCWCNYDSKDNITNHFYTAIYNGTGTSKLRSISGVTLTSANGNGGTTTTQEETRAKANNTTSDVEWYIDVWIDRLLINALLVLMGKSLNTQAVFGRGLDAGGQTAKEAYVTGTLNDKGLFWGDTANGTSAVKVFGMENWWACCWRRTAGCISVNRALKIKLTYGTADGSTVVGYNQTGSGYISNGTIPSTNGYVKAMTYNQYGYMTSNVTGGSSSTYYADYFYQSTAEKYLLVGGSTDLDVFAGAFFFVLHNAPSDARWNFAAALSCKPLAQKG